MTTEQTEQAAKQQYFELRTLLNQANPQKDLITELVFELREDKDEIFIIIRSSSAQHGLRLAYKQKIRGRWIIVENIHFEDFLNICLTKFLS